MGVLNGLHILIVPSWWPSPERPISGVFFADYAGAFATAGAKVGVIFPDLVSMRFVRLRTAVPWRPQVIHENVDGIPVVRTRGWHTSFGQPSLQMRRYRRWLRVGLAAYRERYGSPHVLHAMCAIPAGWACTHLNEPLAARVVITEHTGPFSLAVQPRSAEGFVRTALAKARAVVAVSERTRQQMLAAGIDRSILVCGNPVAELFTTRAFSGSRREGPPRALFVGRLVPEKGVGELLEAATTLEHNTPLQWHFAGDGPMESTITRRFASARLADLLFMHGRCDRPTVAELMAESDFLVLPTHGESFGLVLAEALCVGLPVVTTSAAACADCISSENGMIVPVGDVESLRTALGSMVGGFLNYDRPAIAACARQKLGGGAVAAWYGQVFRLTTGDEERKD
jgi:glycosyltransferase involved in cell wall biosynthesis